MESAAYPVVDVSAWQVAANEPTGIDEKVWLIDDADNSRWLYKPVSTKSWGVQGEDWAEVVVAEIGRLIGVPCARVKLATRQGKRGSISLDLRPRDWELQPGAVLLSDLDPNYRPGWDRIKGRPGHSLENIEKVLRGYGAPPDPHLPLRTAFEVFSGYLLLDALVANRDRHDENWAILRPLTQSAQPKLCGSYDHAGSLGYNLRDDYRAHLLSAGAVASWVRRGTAWRYEHDPGASVPSLVEIARDGLRLAGSEARSTWMARLEALDVTSVAAVLARVPGLSDPAASFAQEVVSLNRRRLLDEC